MLRFVVFSLVAGVLLLGLDYYVYASWQPFAKRRPRLRWTIPVYRGLMVLMPLALPAYFYFSRWWEVDPKLPRFLFIGFWVFYYLPKALVGLLLVVRDGARGVRWLFGWFQRRLLSEPAPSTLAPPTDALAPGGAERLDLADLPAMTRSEFLRQMGWTTASIPFLVVGYGIFRTLYDFRVQDVEVPLAGLPRALDGLRIAQVSDLHAGSFFSARPMHDAAERVLAERPDLIVITGDYVNHDAAELALILPALRKLRADLGVYGCLGNHDHYARVDDVAAGLRTSPVDLLVNAHRTLAVDGARLHLIGTDNTGFSQRYADLPRALSGLQSAPGDEARLLLAHDPTFWDAHVRPAYPDIDLMLAGHTHGGQVGFEFGPLRWSPARIAYARWAGLYTEPRAGIREGHQLLYVNRGLGTVGPPLRLGIRPEITVLTLRRA